MTQSFFPQALVAAMDPQTIAIVLLLIACALCTAMSLVLLYHWNNYGMNNGRIVVARAVYLLVTILIVCVSFISILFI